MAILSFIAGGLLIAFGRRLFWLFVGVVGFFAGMSIAARFIPENTTLLFIIGVGIGVVGAILAVLMQRLAVVVAGFLAGGYVLSTFLVMFGIEPAGLVWLPFVFGGIIGAVLVSVLFDWALIMLSSLMGAVLIISNTAIQPPLSIILIAALFIVGIILQAGLTPQIKE